MSTTTAKKDNQIPPISTTPAAAAPRNADLRKYLDEKQVASIIEAFIVACGEAKPDNIYDFMEQWAQEQGAQTKHQQNHSAQNSGRRRSTRTTPRDSPRERQLALLTNATPMDIIRPGWERLGRIKQLVVAQNFFAILTTQHPILKRTLFRGVDTTDEELATALAATFSAYITGAISMPALEALSKKHAAGRDLEERHLNYFLTAALTALNIAYDDNDLFTAESEAWRIELTKLLTVINTATESQHTPESGTVMNASFRGVVSPFEVVAKSWEDCTQKRQVCQTFFTILFTQHSTVKKALFGNIATEDDAFLNKFENLVTLFFRKEVDVAHLEQLALTLGKELATSGRLQHRHFQYFMTAGLTALQIVFGAEKFAAVQHGWSAELRVLTERLCGVFDALKEEEANNETVSDKDRTLTEMFSAHYGDQQSNNTTSSAQKKQTKEVNNEGEVVTSDDEDSEEKRTASPFDVVRDLWIALDANLRVKVAENFFSVLLSQHQSLKRTIFAEIEPAENYEVLAAAFGQVVKGEFEGGLLRELAAKFAAPRHVQQRHLHYFIVAGLSAFSLILPRPKYQEVAEPLRVVFTHICDEFWYGIQHHDEVLAGRHPKIICQELWTAIRDKRSVLKSFFAVLFTTKPTLKRTLFKGIDTESDEILDLFEAMFTRLLAEGFPMEELKRLGAEHGKPRAVEHRHFQAFLMAAMSALSMSYKSGWGPSVSEPWQRTIQILCNALMDGAEVVVA